MIRFRTSSAKLDELLATLWTSPVFGRSFPDTAPSGMITTIDTMYRRCRADLLAAIAVARSDLDPQLRLGLVDQLAPKSVAFCGALGADEVADAERLGATAVAIALVYLADQTMDRGDATMLWALERLAPTDEPPLALPATPQTARHLALLGAIVQQVSVMARPEDRFELIRCLIQDTLVREARVFRLNRLFLEQEADSFWGQYAGEVAELVVLNGGFVAVAAMVYSVLRHSRPELPPLAAILPGSAPIAAALRAGSAACRIYDDVGDRAIDMGTTRWGVFALNPCNQRDPRFLEALFDSMGVGERSARRALRLAFAEERFDEVLSLTTAFVRAQYQLIPAALWDEYGPFLRLTQRVLEAGRVNTTGDDQLVDARASKMVGVG